MIHGAPPMYVESLSLHQRNVMLTSNTRAVVAGIEVVVQVCTGLAKRSEVSAHGRIIRLGASSHYQDTDHIQRSYPTYRTGW